MNQTIVVAAKKDSIEAITANWRQFLEIRERAENSSIDALASMAGGVDHYFRELAGELPLDEMSRRGIKLVCEISTLVVIMRTLLCHLAEVGDTREAIDNSHRDLQNVVNAIREGIPS